MAARAEAAEAEAAEAAEEANRRLEMDKAQAGEEARKSLAAAEVRSPVPRHSKPTCLDQTRPDQHQTSVRPDQRQTRPASDQRQDKPRPAPSSPAQLTVGSDPELHFPIPASRAPYSLSPAHPHLRICSPPLTP